MRNSNVTRNRAKIDNWITKQFPLC